MKSSDLQEYFTMECAAVQWDEKIFNPELILLREKTNRAHSAKDARGAVL